MRPAALAALLALAVPAAAKYDPDSDRASLRGAALACYDAAARAAGSALDPARAAEIKALVDSSSARGNDAASVGQTLALGAAKRADEMEAVLRGRGGPAPETAAADLARAAATQRARWTADGSDRDGLTKRLDALPKDSPDRTSVREALDAATATLRDADDALGAAESGAASAAAAAADMKERAAASHGPDDELAAAVVQVRAAADQVLARAGEAKTAVDGLGQEPREVSRTKAGDELGAVRDAALPLSQAADRAYNRSDEFRSRSAAFDRALSAYDAARAAAAPKPAAAKDALDRAEKSLNDARARLDRPTPPPATKQ